MYLLDHSLRFSQSIYIGLGDQEVEGVSRWVNYALLGYSDEWADDNDNTEDKDCVVIDPSRKLRHTNCQNRKFALCSNNGKQFLVHCHFIDYKNAF